MSEVLEIVLKFLGEAGTYYLATVEDDQPRVRPFGTALIYNDRLYPKVVYKSTIKQSHLKYLIFREVT